MGIACGNLNVLLKKKLFMILVTTERQTLFKTITTGSGLTAMVFCSRGERLGLTLNNNKEEVGIYRQGAEFCGRGLVDGKLLEKISRVRGGRRGGCGILAKPDLTGFLLKAARALRHHLEDGRRGDEKSGQISRVAR